MAAAAAVPPAATATADARVEPTTFNYVVSASRETVIDHCVSGSFTQENSVDTICSKGSRFEVRTLQDGEEKLDLVCTQHVFGKITCLKLLRCPILNSRLGKEWLLVVTDRPHFFVFSFDNGKLVERAFGSLGEMLSKPVAVPLVVVDAKSRFVLCHLFHGLLSVICFDGKTGGVKETFITSLEELNVLDLEIVSASSPSSQQQNARQILCVLHVDNKDNRHVKTYELNYKNLHEMIPGPWSQPHVEGTAHKLLAAVDGVLVFSSSSIVHLRENTTSFAPTTQTGGASSANPTSTSLAAAPVSQTALVVTIPIFFGRVEALGYVERDGSRVLVGDESGSLHVLIISPSFDMTIDYLGETSVATRLCYLDAGLVFVASRLGDSQLIRLLTGQSNMGESLVEVLETFTNLGPIVSMCLMDLESKGQLVTCSGGVKDGSLRTVRNGVGVDEQCAIDLPGITGMWGLKRINGPEEYDAFLVQSFPTETRVLGFTKEESSSEIVLGEMSLAADSLFDVTVPTLFCGNLGPNDGIVQVTAHRVRFMRSSVFREDGDIVSAEMDTFVDWPIPADRRVTLASAFKISRVERHCVLLALTGGLLVVIDSTGQELVQVQMEHEISSACANDKFIAVGLWSDLSIRVLDSETGRALDSTAAAAAGGSHQQDDAALATSIALCRFSTLMHLLVGYGDGCLIIYCLDEASGKFSSKRSLTLGLLPVELTAFTDSMTGSRYVFAACDRPSIVYCAPHAQDKLLLSNVNIPMSSVSHIAPFNSESFPNCLALASDETLVIGMVSDVQKIHVRSFPLGERPGRIAHQPSSGTFGVCVFAADSSEEEEGGGATTTTSAFQEQCRLRLIDDRSFKVVDSFRFDETELPFCIISTSFAGDATGSTSTAGGEKNYFVVGTAYSDDDPEPNRGRIIVFEVSKMDGDSERKLFMVTEKTVKGGVYDLCTLACGKLVAGVNAKIQVFSWTERGNMLQSSSTPRHATAGTTTAATTTQDLLLQDASFHGHTLSLNVRTFGEYIVVGDLVKSVSLLHYDAKKSTIKEVSRALPPSWVTSLAILDETSFLISDTEGNLVVLRPDRVSLESDEESTLVAAGEFYWGDFVNCICLGSLTMPASTQDGEVATTSSISEKFSVRANPKLLFGTASGAIGVLATLTAKEFALLDRLQKAMNNVCIGVGGQTHATWRSFRANGKTRDSRGFIDGDLVETLLELETADLDRVCEAFNQGLTQRDPSQTLHTDEPERVNVEDLLRLVEDLTRLH